MENSSSDSVRPFNCRQEAIANLTLISRLLADERFSKYFTNEFEKKLFREAENSVNLLTSYLKLKTKTRKDP